MTELAYISAAELGRRIARRELSPLEAVDATLSRIDAVDTELNSYVLKCADRARAEARALEAIQPLGPLHGVPLALKDIFDTAGLETTAGSKILKGNIPPQDAAVVEKLRRAGTVLLGKLNMHEFAYGTTNDNRHYGFCRNPWDRDRVPGGSSGGSGAALAAGLCHLSLGTDTGGSIRVPASACGIVGLKPTFGRVSRRGVVPLAWSLDHVGPMTRTVEDAALLLDAIAGHDPADPWSVARPVDPFTRLLGQPIAGLRLGLIEDPVLDMVEPETAAAVAAATDLLTSLKATTHQVKLAHFEHAQTALHGILAGESSAYHLPWLRERPQDYGDNVRGALELGCFLPAVDYVNARRMQSLIADDIAAALDAVDLLVLPTLPRPAGRVGEEVSREPSVAWNRLVTPFNLAGLPAISLPCGFTSAGLPIGLQIVGRAWDEARVLQAAHAYERATDFHTRKPRGVN